MGDLADYRNFCKCTDDHQHSERCSGAAVCVAHEEAIDSEISRLEDELNRQRAKTEYEAELHGNALNDLDAAIVRAAKFEDECERLQARLEDARVYAAVCPVPTELTGPARFEMLERRARLGQRDGNPNRRCIHGKLFTESCDGCGVVHPNDTEKQSSGPR